MTTQTVPSFTPVDMTIFMDDVEPGHAEEAVDDGHPAGDCMRASVASILGLPLEAVPHFVQYRRPADAHLWWWALIGFCHVTGWEVGYVEEPPRGWALASGLSPRGHEHVVVAFAGEVVHDPHPSRAGIVEVKEWFSFERVSA